MSAPPRLVTAGRVGRPHGLDGSFWVEEPGHALPAGTEVTVSGATLVVERRAGTDSRPLLRLVGIDGREAARSLSGELLLVAEHDAPLAPDEWLAGDLEGCDVPGLGRVSRVLGAPSCDLLELEDGTLVPLVSDAVRKIDVERRLIEVDRRFLGRDEERT